MVLKSVWHNADNVLEFYDKEFDAVTEDFELIFVRREICNRFVVPVGSVKFCGKKISFCFVLECQIPSGTYDVTVKNLTKDEEIITVGIRVYANPNKCLNCQ